MADDRSELRTTRPKWDQLAHRSSKGRPFSRGRQAGIETRCLKWHRETRPDPPKGSDLFTIRHLLSVYSDAFKSIHSINKYLHILCSVDNFNEAEGDPARS